MVLHLILSAITIQLQYNNNFDTSIRISYLTSNMFYPYKLFHNLPFAILNNNYNMQYRLVSYLNYVFI